MTQTQLSKSSKQQHFQELVDDDSETEEVDIEELIRCQSEQQGLQNMNSQTLSYRPQQSQLLPNIDTLGPYQTSVSQQTIQINQHKETTKSIPSSIDINYSYPGEKYSRHFTSPTIEQTEIKTLQQLHPLNSLTQFDHIEYSKQTGRSSPSMKRKEQRYFHSSLQDNLSSSSLDVTSDTTDQKKPPKKFKTEPRRLTYLREKKIYGRNEESEIINGLQFLLIQNHGAVFEYVKEKRSKKTIKFRMPYAMYFNGICYPATMIAEMGEQWLIDRGLCVKCSEKVVTAKRIQRSKEAEVNGGLICILHSLGYEFEFKKLKDKTDRKTTPFVKISAFKYPHEDHFRSVDDLKELGRKYNQIMLLREEDIAHQN